MLFITSYMPSVPARMFRFSQGHFYCTSFSKQNVLLKSHLHVILILLNIYFYINAILDGIFKNKKTPLNEWSLLSLILQIDLYTIYSYTSIEYMITSLLVSLLKQTPLQF